MQAARGLHALADQVGAGHNFINAVADVRQTERGNAPKPGVIQLWMQKIGHKKHLGLFSFQCSMPHPKIQAGKGRWKEEGQKQPPGRRNPPEGGEDQLPFRFVSRYGIIAARRLLYAYFMIIP